MEDCSLFRILIVDDDEDDYLITRDLLSDIESLIIQVERARDRDEALRRMEAGFGETGAPYDVCFLDYRLGPCNGLDILREAVSAGFSAPIILLTGQEDTSVDREAVEAGASDYLIKGRINPVLLERSIRYACQQKRTQEALRESHEKYRSLVDVTSDWIWEVDAQGFYTHVSPQIRESLGYLPEEVVGKTPFDLMPPEEVERIRIRSEEIVSDRRPFQDLENAMVAQDGKRFVFEISGTPLFDVAGKWIGYRGVNRDITARKEVEEALRRQEEFVSAVLDTAGALVVVLDRHGFVVRFNRACETTTGYRHAELEDGPFWEILLTDEEKPRMHRTFKNMVAGYFPNQYENDWVTRSGQLRRISWSNTALLDEAGAVEFVVSTGIDVTERRRAERALAEAREREVEVGSSIQRTLLVRQPPVNLPGLQLGAASLPSLKIGGDYFDIFPFREGCVDVVVGDVMGKGVPAALLAAATKSQFQKVIWQLTLETVPYGRLPEPAEIISAVHAVLTPDLMALGSFITLTYARFDLERSLMTLIECGHPRPLHLSQDSGECRSLAGHNMPLGMNAREQYIPRTVPFAPGDLFAFYSDGLVEACRREGPPGRQTEEEFGEQRLIHTLGMLRQEEPQRMAEAACEAVREYVGEEGALALDDLTCLVVRVDEPATRGRIGLQSLEVPSDPDYLGAVRQFIGDFCHRHAGARLSEEAMDLIVLAVNEAVANIMKHAYRGWVDRRIRVEAESYPACVIFRLIDSGDLFEAPSGVSPPVFDGSRDSGFGVYLMRECMDEVTYHRDEMGRNCMTLIKRLDLETAIASPSPGREAE